MKIQKATAKFEAWLASHLTLVEQDLKLKHERMREGAFLFLRATFYRWAQLWPEISKELAEAPRVLAVGDLHIENFGTWRDAEGRLVWGINDFDEAWWMPYPNDLVRLAASAILAATAGHLTIGPKEAADAILLGYDEALATGGRPFVLAEHHSALRNMATHRLKDPESFWQKLDKIPALRRALPESAAKALSRALPEPDLSTRMVHRVAGVGSLGRQRFVAIADWRGGKIAREAKAMAPSACIWAAGGKGSAKILYPKILGRSVRCPDPFFTPKGRWIVRRLAPDCSRIELSDFPAERDETRLLHAMGWETANVHLGTADPRTLRRDLKRRTPGWLHQAAIRMAEAVSEDWDSWRKAPKT